MPASQLFGAVRLDKNATEPVAVTETLAEVPEHVLRGLPEEVRLLPSAVDKTRIGVWATKPILKGKKFGPFVGDKKKRSQVKNNVYMWEVRPWLAVQWSSHFAGFQIYTTKDTRKVYYPNLGWMCIDATDPEKGNWLRYVNWACSGEEQNLFPLEINRAIYYKTLKPIAPGEELLVWYNGEDNPEIAAAIEEERASARSKRNSPKSKKGKKKSQENKSKGNKTEDIKLKTSKPDSIPANMRDSAEATVSAWHPVARRQQPHTSPGSVGRSGPRLQPSSRDPSSKSRCFTCSLTAPEVTWNQ
ncbi:PR domain zinc finger protein 2 isoform X4 [Elephas maximus indicus]|uniref:PR domain zinc finger protein 2 isoform X4 n=1 Tax=Elephas maximus indicus TaxID=99487 RepID=UPI0021169BCE|nr:PR domain zinc finger protein 2 isoform X4 [Elephas maximus indicus]